MATSIDRSRPFTERRRRSPFPRWRFYTDQDARALLRQRDNPKSLVLAEVIINQLLTTHKGLPGSNIESARLQSPCCRFLFPSCSKSGAADASADSRLQDDQSRDIGFAQLPPKLRCGPPEIFADAMTKGATSGSAGSPATV